MDPFAGFLGAVNTVSDIFSGFGQQSAAEKNLAMQRENLDWLKESQRESWERDDNAVQRRAADLSAAGINPLLAAGSAAGNSPVVHTEAPQIDPMAASAGSRGVSSAARSAVDTLSMQKDFAVKDAQAQLLQAQKNSTDADAEYKRAITPGAAEAQESQSALNRTSASVQRANNLSSLLEAQGFDRKSKDDFNYTLDQVYKAAATGEARRNIQYRFESLRSDAAQKLAQAGIDKDLADSLSYQYAADMAKNEVAVSNATLPAHIAGPYAEVAGKVIGAGANLGLASWLKKWLDNKPDVVEVKKFSK